MIWNTRTKYLNSSLPVNLHGGIQTWHYFTGTVHLPRNYTQKMCIHSKLNTLLCIIPCIYLFEVQVTNAHFYVNIIASSLYKYTFTLFKINNNKEKTKKVTFYYQVKSTRCCIAIFWPWEFGLLLFVVIRWKFYWTYPIKINIENTLPCYWRNIQSKTDFLSKYSKI